MDVYEGNNANAQLLTRAYDDLKKKNVTLVDKTNQVYVKGQTVIFEEPLEMFEKVPYNDTLKEGNWRAVKVTEGKLLDIYTFKKKSTGGG